MKGDFSRDTYRPASGYTRVLMQQGRVQLDSDWNEQTSILLGYMRALTRDLFGPAAGPSDDCGFRIVTAENGAGLPADVQAQVDAELENGALDADDLLILPGRYYVGGLPVESTEVVRYRAQAGLPAGQGPGQALRTRSWLAYLDVWEEFVSADQDPFIRETALNGVDTCGRARICWQVRLIVDPKEGAVNRLEATGSGRLRARANPTEEADGLCSIEPDARYRGAENQLYRVEIHAGGEAAAGGGATFKWSRDNGSTVFPIRSATGDWVTLAHLGRDEATTLVEGDWVELIDDRAALSAGAGLLAQVADVRRDDFRVRLAAPDAALPAYEEAQAEAGHAFLRRWDHAGNPKRAGGAIPVAEGAANEFELEDGIKVTFENGGNYRPGDYWMIPARVATGDVEWPGSPDHPDFQRPHGPVHHYAPLARRVHFANKAPEFQDLRCRIARLPCIADAKTAPSGTTTTTAATGKK